MKNDNFSILIHQVKSAFRLAAILATRVGILVFSINFIWASNCCTQISVGVFTHKPVSTILLSPKTGRYHVVGSKGDTLYQFRTDDAISVSAFGDRLILKGVYGLADTISEANLVGSALKPSLKLRADDESRECVYFENLKISSDEGKLKIINQVDIEQYVSRVVQAEVGYGANTEYYKIQSIICRTYAVKNLERHVLDGYDLCDMEHCQVYSGLKTPSNEVKTATVATSGLVMLDKANALILSAFHANCGGQTSNSEDVWRESRSYLTSVTDTFCLQSRSATWDKWFPMDEFLNQLGFNSADTLSDQLIPQPTRSKYFTLEKDSIETSKMRRLLGLRSTYFDAEFKDGQVKLSGRGYGHGVGLCQQGAMEMARIGYTYSQILGYYYKGVSLAPISAIQSAK